MNKILLVDDDRDFVDAVKTVLESKPEYEVLTISDGVFAMPIAKAEKPDLVILDIIMPFEDGFAVAKQLKEDPETSEIPVIILTSFSQNIGNTDIPVSQGMVLDAEDYLEKPIAPEVLLARVDKIIRHGN